MSSVSFPPELHAAIHQTTLSFLLRFKKGEYLQNVVVGETKLHLFYLLCGLFGLLRCLAMWHLAFSSASSNPEVLLSSSLPLHQENSLPAAALMSQSHNTTMPPYVMAITANPTKDQDPFLACMAASLHFIFSILQELSSTLHHIFSSRRTPYKAFHHVLCSLGHLRRFFIMFYLPKRHPRGHFCSASF